MDSDSDYSTESFQMSDDHKGPSFDRLRHDVEDIKDMIRKLYKQVDSFDAKRAELQQDFEQLRKANKDFSMKVRDLHEILRNPPHVRVYSVTPSSPHRYVDRLDTRDYSYGSTRSSRSSSFRNIQGSGTVDDYDDDDLSDDNYDERTFTKSVENFEIEDTSDA